MAKKQAGDTFVYSGEDKEYYATVINTFTNEDSTDMATLSLLGEGKTIVVENDFE